MSSVVVDMRMATLMGDLVSPTFKNVKDVWVSSNSNEAYEIFKSSCGVPNCFASACAVDLYSEIQKKEIEKADSKLKTFLEEFDTEEASEHGNTQEVIEELNEYMENDDLILLLPGVVNGYALRNRKWGKLFPASVELERDLRKQFHSTSTISNLSRRLQAGMNLFFLKATKRWSRLWWKCMLLEVALLLGTLISLRLIWCAAKVGLSRIFSCNDANLGQARDVLSYSTVHQVWARLQQQVRGSKSPCQPQPLTPFRMRCVLYQTPALPNHLR